MEMNEKNFREKRGERQWSVRYFFFVFNNLLWMVFLPSFQFANRIQFAVSRCRRSTQLKIVHRLLPTPTPPPSSFSSSSRATHIICSTIFYFNCPNFMFGSYDMPRYIPTLLLSPSIPLDLLSEGFRCFYDAL